MITVPERERQGRRVDRMVARAAALNRDAHLSTRGDLSSPAVPATQYRTLPASTERPYVRRRRHVAV